MPKLSKKKSVARKKQRCAKGSFLHLKRSSRINDTSVFSNIQLTYNKLNQLCPTYSVKIAKMLCVEGVVQIYLPLDSNILTVLKTLVINESKNITNLKNSRKSININLESIINLNLFSKHILQALKFYLQSKSIFLVQCSAISVPARSTFQNVHRDVTFFVGPQQVCSLVVSLSSKIISTYFINKTHIESSGCIQTEDQLKGQQLVNAISIKGKDSTSVVLFDLYIKHFGNENSEDVDEIDRIFFTFVGCNGKEKYQAIKTQISCGDENEWIKLL
jgi:hypothetical protein